MPSRRRKLYQYNRRGAQFKNYVINQEDKIERLPVKEALRLTGNVYGVLIAEAYMEGCVECGNYFQCLKDIENYLLESAFINMRVSENKELLLRLLENAKAAEQVSKIKQCDNSQICYKLLFQILRNTKTYPADYEWLVGKLFDIIARIADKYSTKIISNYEIRAKIYCMYAMYLSRQTVAVARFQQVYEYFNKALELCRGQYWRSDEITRVFNEYNLQELTALSFAQMLTKYARSHLEINPRTGIVLADKAIFCIAEINQRKIVPLLDAILIKVRFLLETNDLVAADKQLLMARRYMRGNTTPGVSRCRCEALIYSGICYKRLDQPKMALKRYKQAYTLCSYIGATKLAATALLDMGKIYIFTLYNEILAYETLTEARRLFIELNDMRNLKRTIYFLAKMQSQAFYLAYIKLIKRADYNFNDLYVLRKWKFLQKPFWNRQVGSLENEGFLNEQDDRASTTSSYQRIHRHILKTTLYTDNLTAMQMPVKTDPTFNVKTSKDPIKCLLQEGKILQGEIPSSETESTDDDMTADEEEEEEEYEVEEMEGIELQDD